MLQVNGRQSFMTLIGLINSPPHPRKGGGGNKIQKKNNEKQKKKGDNKDRFNYTLFFTKTAF